MIVDEYCAQLAQLKKGRTVRRRTKIAIAALVAVVGYAYFSDDINQVWDDFHVKLPEYAQSKEKPRWLKQNVSQEKLDTIFEMPGEDFKMPYFDLYAFTMYREANCIGQIALYRRLLGYEAMKYM